MDNQFIEAYDLAHSRSLLGLNRGARKLASFNLVNPYFVGGFLKEAAYVPEPGVLSSPIKRILRTFSPPKPKVPYLPREKPTTPYKNTYSEEKI